MNVAHVSELRTNEIAGCAEDEPCYLRIHAAADFLMLEAELDWYADNWQPAEIVEQEIDWLSAEPFSLSRGKEPGPFEGELTITRDCPELVGSILTAFVELGAICRIDPFEPLHEWAWPRYCADASQVAEAVSAIQEYRDDSWNEELSRRVDALGVFYARLNSSVCSVAVACTEFALTKRVVCNAWCRAGIEIRLEKAD